MWPLLMLSPTTGRRGCPAAGPCRADHAGARHQPVVDQHRGERPVVSAGRLSAARPPGPAVHRRAPGRHAARHQPRHGHVPHRAIPARAEARAARAAAGQHAHHHDRHVQHPLGTPDGRGCQLAAAIRYAWIIVRPHNT